MNHLHLHGLYTASIGFKNGRFPIELAPKSNPALLYRGGVPHTLFRVGYGDSGTDYPIEALPPILNLTPTPSLTLTAALPRHGASTEEKPPRRKSLHLNPGEGNRQHDRQQNVASPSEGLGSPRSGRVVGIERGRRGVPRAQLGDMRRS